MSFLTIEINSISELISEVPIFLFETHSQKRSLFFHAGHEITQESLQSAKELSEKGGVFQIHSDFQEEFIKQFDLSIDYLIGLNQDHYFMLDLIKERESFAESNLNKEFNFKDTFNTCFEKQNFAALISQVKSEIALFDYSIGHQHTMNINTVFELLNRDSKLNRQVSFVYLFAKLLNIKDEASLLDCMIACYLKDIGLTQLKRPANYKEYLIDDNFGKAAPYTLFMLNKTNLDLSLLIKRILLEVHELYDGSGAPKGKKEDQIHILSQVCSLANILFQYSDDMDVIANKLIKALEIDGKVYAYHPEVLKNLEYLFSQS
tara:strand:- start:16458 stop:17414 length:957 start_codon:yes stop_codon:yes gene_type:complete